MLFYQGFWYLSFAFQGIISFQSHFEAHDTDILLASLPKTGTTWLKSLLYAIVNRENISKNHSQHPLHTKNPHELVPQLGLNQPETIAQVPSPRLFATHVPYSSLPESIKTSNCRIVYVCRNPLDTFVSSWHYFLQFEMSKETKPNKEMMEEYLIKYSKGVSPYGPHDEHVLGYWKESIQNPTKVLFLEYEGLKKEPKAHLIRLAEFLGFPFSAEEKDNVVEEILELCSIKNLKEMEVNKSGQWFPWVENKYLFRKGEVGDWINHLTPSMAKQFDQMQENLKKAGFSSKYYQI
ncbi:Cytosolic sulfotransferase 13 [Bienertia sinuspersici]